MVKSTWNARDGWRAQPYDSLRSEEIGVELLCRVNGEIRVSEKVWVSPTRSPEAVGHRSRVLALWQAITRFWNSGGSCEELRTVSEQAAYQGSAYRIRIPDRLSLLDTIQEVEEAQHLFADLQTGEAVVFTEDSYVEKTTLGKLGHRLRQEYEHGDAEEAGFL